MSIKNSFLALFLFISVTQFACKKDSETSIVGKWTVESLRTKTSAPAASGIPSGDETESLSGQTVEFRSDGSYQSCENGDCFNGYYQKSGNIIKFSDTQDFADAESFTIQSLTNKNMVLYSKSTETIGGYVINMELWINLRR